MGAPAVEALATIGLPALPSLLEVIRSAPDVRRRHAAAGTIGLMFAGLEGIGPWREAAYDMLMRAERAASDKQSREHLREAADWLRSGRIDP